MLDATAVLSGPDGGMCAHELPVFRLPAAAANQPALDSANGLYVFDRGAAAAHYFQARSTFFVDLESSGGFTAVVAIRVRTNPVTTGTMTVLLMRGPGGAAVIAGQIGAVAGSQPTLRFTDSSRDYLTESVSITTGAWIVLAFHYVHSTYEWSVYVNGVQEGNDAQSAVRSCRAIASFRQAHGA